jgi:hypothetical protein
VVRSTFAESLTFDLRSCPLGHGSKFYILSGSQGSKHARLKNGAGLGPAPFANYLHPGWPQSQRSSVSSALSRQCSLQNFPNGLFSAT